MYLASMLKKKKLFLNKKNFFLLVLILLTFICDRVIKIKIIKDFSNKIHHVNDFINIDLIWNTGIGFGLLSSDSKFIYNSVTVLVISAILFLFYITILSKNFDKFIFTFIIGGALGNFYDRLVYNAVPDFIDLHYKNFHWFTFNAADIFITLGVVIFLIKSSFIKN